jgi:hypothetical protein
MAPFDMDSGVGSFSTYGYRIDLLKERDPTKWNEIMELGSFVNKEKESCVEYLKKMQLEAEMEYLKVP